MRTKLFLVILFVAVFASSLSAQQSIPIVNNSFEIDAPLPSDWNNGPIPGWQITPAIGLWQPDATEYNAIPDGVSVAWSDGGTLSQDLGTGAGPGTYTFQVYVGHRMDATGTGVTYTLTLLAGTTTLCTKSGLVDTIPLGTFAPISQTCVVSSPVPSGDLIVSLGCSVLQCDFDDVTLNFVPLPAAVTNMVTVSLSAQYDDGSVPTILQVGIMDVTVTPSVINLMLTPDSTTGAASGSLTISSNDTYEVILYIAGAQVGQTFYVGSLVQALMPQISHANFSVVLFKATGLVKSFSSGAS